MAEYKIHVFCDECAETHPMPITVKLDDGPAVNSRIIQTTNS
jgi:hypothetical protein